jgi:polysaccharide pyruvyl transferase WcaK-like protein
LCPGKARDLMKYNYSIMANDVDAINKTFENVINKDKVVCLTDYYDVTELKWMLSRCSAFVGCRMHSCIGAVSSFTPTVSIHLNYKSQGLMRIAGLDEYDCDVASVTSQELYNKIEAMWTNRNNIRSNLKMRMPAINSRIYEIGTDLAKFIDNKHLSA